MVAAGINAVDTAADMKVEFPCFDPVGDRNFCLVVGRSGALNSLMGPYRVHCASHPGKFPVQISGAATVFNQIAHADAQFPFHPHPP
jgi:hypothetical protein